VQQLTTFQLTELYRAGLSEIAEPLANFETSVFWKGCTRSFLPKYRGLKICKEAQLSPRDPHDTALSAEMLSTAAQRFEESDFNKAYNN